MINSRALRGRAQPHGVGYGNESAVKALCLGKTKMMVTFINGVNSFSTIFPIKLLIFARFKKIALKTRI